MAIQLRASYSFSSVPFSTRPYTHDVFLSFRGEETRSGFTGHLYRALVKEGVKTFIDDGLPRGEEISQSLLRVIEGSKLSLIVFSKNYAGSKWCLDELVHILECRRWKNQMVRPIFYGVDPSDVRNQRGTYGEALAEHERRFYHDPGKVLGWRAALSEAGNLSGWHFKGGYEYELIEKIIEEICPQVREPTKMDVANCPVGIDSRVQYMLKILDVGGSDVRMVGIWGIGGIGKTTVAKAVYNTIARQFEGSCFLADVREASQQHGGLVKLQNALLSDIVKEKGLKINNVHEGIALLRERLRGKKILLVLDDVDDLGQLEKLAGKIDWFGRGSRVIITTRDSHLLNAHEVKPIYKVPELAHHEAVELFSSNVFKGGKSLDDNEELLVATMVKYAQGIPLALEVLGSYLRNASVDEWQAMLDDFRIDPPKRIQDILNISYAGLKDRVKKVFLDIACFFKGWKRNDVIQILEGCNRINPKNSIKLLEEKALIYVSDDHIYMHDLLEEMGKDKVLLESKEPGERSRLWHHKDVQDVLTESTGTKSIEGIIVKMPTEDEIQLSPKCFKKMKNLMIFINVNARFCGKVDDLPNQLRVLDWPRCPLHSLPSNFNGNNIIQLKIPGSRIARLGFKSMQNLKSLNLRNCDFLKQSPDLSGSPNLEFLDLSFCRSLVEVHPSVGFLEKLVHLKLRGCKLLTQISDMSGSPNLEFLDLSGCESLVEVHHSVGFLEKLFRLDLKGCSNLVMLPGRVNWRSLEFISLDNCRRLENFPEIVGEMKHLTSLVLWDVGIKALPSSIRNLINLEVLYLLGCRKFTDLPGSIYELHKLKRVRLEDCPKLVTFPNKVDSEVLPTYSMVSRDDRVNLVLPLLGFTARGCNLSNLDFLASLGCASTLTELDLSGSTFVSLSECIIKFVQLRELKLSGNRRLVEIPELPPRIELLDVSDCVSLERISKLSNISERKDSFIMIEKMYLTNCWRLCENLIKMAKEEDVELYAGLFYRLLSSGQSKFVIIFPVQRNEIPSWFSCQMDYKGCRRFEFYVEMLENFKWENTGLAISGAFDNKLKDTSTKCVFRVFIHSNEVCVSDVGPHIVNSRESNHVWMQYKPFHEMWRFGYMRPLPPFSCRVIIHQVDDSWASLKSCGVHLVMPPNEDICMKLIRAENLTSELPDDVYQDYWDNYLPKQGTDCEELYTDALLENEKV